jgi:PAS domain S-box-containing protein
MSAPAPVPRSFRRESRFFLWIALVLILFLNFVTLLFFRNAVEWGRSEAERRAGDLLRRVATSSNYAEEIERVALQPGVLFVGVYDAQGRRLQGSAGGAEAPLMLPGGRPGPGRTGTDWQREPPVLLLTLEAGGRYFLAGMDAGPGAALSRYVRTLGLLVPIAGAILVVLAFAFLRSLLAPYERLLAAAGGAPRPPGEHADERDFLIAQFESTIAALREKEGELARLAQSEKARADDLETTARTLSRNLPTGLLSVEPNGAILEVNEAGREILGLPAEVRGTGARAALAALPELAELISGVLVDHRAVGRRELSWRRGGEERTLGVTVAPATAGDGRFLGALALFTDLTEVKRLEARVALARHLAGLGEVSAGAAHEFRNAAAAIDGFADLALRRPERAAEFLQSIRLEAQELSRITGDFLLFAQPERFAPEPVDLSRIAEGAAEETRAAFPGVEIARRGGPVTVAGSPVLLKRAVVNLLRNAIEATPLARRGDPEAVALSCDAREEDAALTVLDRGPGVDPSDRERIFLPFTSTKPEGGGFGLAIVARIVDLHGGTVEVSDREGGGAAFTVRLPAPSSAVSRPGPRQPTT